MRARQPRPRQKIGSGGARGRRAPPWYRVPRAGTSNQCLAAGRLANPRSYAAQAGGSRSAFTDEQLLITPSHSLTPFAFQNRRMCDRTPRHAFIPRKAIGLGLINSVELKAPHEGLREGNLDMGLFHTGCGGHARRQSRGTSRHFERKAFARGPLSRAALPGECPPAKATRGPLSPTREWLCGNRRGGSGRHGCSEQPAPGFACRQLLFLGSRFLCEATSPSSDSAPNRPPA